MQTVILGGSGFIGRKLCSLLASQGHHVLVPTRRSAHPQTGPVTFVHWDGRSSSALAEIVEGAETIINLAGENIAAGRWSAPQRERIVQSRLSAGKALCEALGGLRQRPRVLIQASALGYYGFWADMVRAPLCTEERGPGTGFLAATAAAWEDSTKDVEGWGVRRCIIRTAPVLGPEGGMLNKLLPPFRWGLGARPGTGRQPLAWIHLDDEAAAIAFLMQHEGLSGPFNLVAPEETAMNDFVHTLGQALRRPARLWLPGPLLRLIWGDMATELLLGGQKAAPSRLLEAGFVFRFPNLKTALGDILSS